LSALQIPALTLKPAQTLIAADDSIKDVGRAKYFS